MIDNIAFSNYKKNSDIHGTVLYPAVMVAPVQNAILRELIKQDDIKTIFDPFHGSGTALYEAWEIDPSLFLVGCDINPLANLITKVKLNGVTSHIDQDITKLKELIKNPGNIYEYSFPKIDKWFREDIIREISIIRSGIIQIDSWQNRQFFWYMLCDVIRKFSNTSSSTYKLYQKNNTAIARISTRVSEYYFKKIDNGVDLFRGHDSNFTLYKEDILDLLPRLPERKFDIVITSPPYGENATTVPYGQFSMLNLYTIDKMDLELKGWETENYSKIDSRSLGGSFRKRSRLSETEYLLIQPYLDRISTCKQKKIINFFTDYFYFLLDMCRITNKYIVLTLGNRTVDGIKINLSSITTAYIEQQNYCLIDSYERTIPQKRIPQVTSCVKKKPVSSMCKEYVNIYKRSDSHSVHGPHDSKKVAF